MGISGPSSEGDDLYALLGFDVMKVDVLSLTLRELASSYRRQALRWHPDKNPGDAKAAEMLARVFVAHETLSDPDRRAKHDDVLRAKRARELERAALNADRRKLRDELVQREQESQAMRGRSRGLNLSADVEARLQREIERLRVDHGLALDKNAAEAMDVDADESGGTRASTARVSSPWEEVPGFKEWGTGQIKFETFEADVLARARGALPSEGSGKG